MTASLHAPAPHTAPTSDRLRLGMWLFVTMDVMSFAALLLAHAVLRARASSWPTVAGELGRDAIGLAALGTWLLAAASLSVDRALAAAQRGRRRPLLGWLTVTVIAGAGFLALQAREYLALLGHGKGIAQSLFHSTFVVITGYHGAHVLAGVVLCTVMLSNAVDGRYTDAGAPGYCGTDALAATALYWHFVDGIWLVLLLRLYLF